MSAQQVVSIAEQQLGISGRPKTSLHSGYGSIGGTTLLCMVLWYSSAGVSLRRGLAFFRERQAWYVSLDYAKENGIFQVERAATRQKAGGHYDPAVRRRKSMWGL